MGNAGSAGPANTACASPSRPPSFLSRSPWAASCCPQGSHHALSRKEAPAAMPRTKAGAISRRESAGRAGSCPAANPYGGEARHPCQSESALPPGSSLWPAPATWLSCHNVRLPPEPACTEPPPAEESSFPSWRRGRDATQRTTGVLHQTLNGSTAQNTYPYRQGS